MWLILAVSIFSAVAVSGFFVEKWNQKTRVDLVTSEVATNVLMAFGNADTDAPYDHQIDLSSGDNMKYHYLADYRAVVVSYRPNEDTYYRRYLTLSWDKLYSTKTTSELVITDLLRKNNAVSVGNKNSTFPTNVNYFEINSSNCSSKMLNPIPYTKDYTNYHTKEAEESLATKICLNYPNNVKIGKYLMVQQL